MSETRKKRFTFSGWEGILITLLGDVAGFITAGVFLYQLIIVRNFAFWWGLGLLGSIMTILFGLWLMFKDAGTTN